MRRWSSGYVDDHPLGNLFGVDTGSTSYVAGQWTGVVGTFAVDGYGAYKAVSGGIKAVKAVKLAMSEGEDFVGAVKRLLSGDLPTTTPADPAPTTPKNGDAPSTPKAGTGKGGKEPGGSGKEANDQPLEVKGRDQKNVGVEKKGPESVTTGRRADGAKVYSGHGTYGRNTGNFTVPQGTRLHFYVPHGRKLGDSAGLAVERGVDAPGAVESFGPGDILPDYVIGPPTDLNIMSGSRTVTRPTGISALITQGMGEVHMAMCREFDPYMV
ncbi:putative adhesin [Streptomyces sp. NRRL S-646]|uniref:putative adhesin n=1 Tax=Streptomyces sp. NRRL S-646 TaxID=1463917 RepID=UPI0004C63B92|nr:hypothetical protein [Streptomyces sp. NRRL S-646]